MLRTNVIYNEDCVKGMGENIPNDTIDIIVTSPPYNLKINYNDYEDNMDYNDYLKWCEEWISECYRVLKFGGRICINVPMESNLGGKKIYYERLY